MNLSADDPFGQRILDPVQQSTLQGTYTIVGIITFPYQVTFGRFAHCDRAVHQSPSSIEILDLEIDDAEHVPFGERCKGYNIVDPVDEFRRESPFQTFAVKRFTLLLLSCSFSRRVVAYAAAVLHRFA